MNQSPLKDSLGLLLFLGLSFVAALVGSLFTGAAIDSWYDTIAKPSWTPPDWIFGPVWTLLYVAMAVAAWLVWRQAGWSHAGTGLTLFSIQLVLNAAWSALFFCARNPGLAFAEIVLLWGAILATLLAFWRVRPLAGMLFVPYLAWVTFAAVLNYAIWRLNS